MSKQVKVLAQLGGLGLGVTAVFYVAFFLVRYLPRLLFELTTDLLGIVSAVLCPASLGIVPHYVIYESQSIVGDPSCWILIGVTNSATYAAIGYLAMRLLSRAASRRPS